jgi:hypothetical protein
VRVRVLADAGLGLREHVRDLRESGGHGTIVLLNDVLGIHGGAAERLT